MKKLVFVHGWGFNPDLWRPLVVQLRGIEPVFIDLGFIKGTREHCAAEIPPGSIVAGHSLGALWLLRQRRDFHAFISLAGIDCFHAYVPASAIEAMKDNLARSASAQMRGFWKACGAEDFAPDENLDPLRLKEGLEWLAGWDARPERAALSCPVLALASRADAIVGERMTRSIWKDEETRWIETGGHALPLTVPAWCAREIQDFIDALE